MTIKYPNNAKWNNATLNHAYNFLQTIPYPVYIDTCIGHHIFTVVGPYRVKSKVRDRASYGFMDFLLQFVAFTAYSAYYLSIPDMVFSCY